MVFNPRLECASTTNKISFNEEKGTRRVFPNYMI